MVCEGGVSAYTFFERFWVLVIVRFPCFQHFIVALLPLKREFPISVFQWLQGSSARGGGGLKGFLDNSSGVAVAFRVCMVVVLGNDGGTSLVIRFRIGPERQEGGSNRAQTLAQASNNPQHQHGCWSHVGDFFPSHLVSLATAPLPLYNNPFTSLPLFRAAADIYHLLLNLFCSASDTFVLLQLLALLLLLLSFSLVESSHVLFSALTFQYQVFLISFLITLLCTRYQD